MLWVLASVLVTGRLKVKTGSQILSSLAKRTTERVDKIP